MHEEHIIQFLKEDKGLSDSHIEGFLSEYRMLNDAERSRVIFEVVGKELYKEYPVDMRTFIHDPYFLGSIYSDIIFPIWEDTLYDIYPAPFCKKYNEAILSCATRCFAKGTKVRMFDGSIKNVEDVVVGDELMGPDNKPRTIKSLSKGTQPMYEVNPIKGRPFTCNERHLLYLKNVHSNEVIEVETGEFNEWSDLEKDHWRLIHSNAIEYSKKDLKVSPYLFGFWLAGFMHSDIPMESLPYLQSTIINKCRRIPKEYLTSSLTDRRELLAGIIDAFLPSSNKTPRYTGYRLLLMKTNDLLLDVEELCQSMGLSCHIVSQDENNSRVYISGDMRNISCRYIKNNVPDVVKKDVLLTGFNVTAKGVGEFYGFEVDGDHLFLLQDYMIVRNSGKSTTIVISALYEMYLLLCMISPYKTLNVKNTANLTFAFLSKDNPTACSQVGEDVHKGLTQSPYFVDVITNNLSFSNLDKKGVQVTNNILLKAGSTVNVLTGTDLIFGCLDEANMPSPKISAETLVDVRTKLYRTMVDRRNATFSKAPALTGMIWLTSSPMDEGDVIGERIDEVISNDIQNVYIMDNIPRWVARNEMKEDTFDFFLGSNTQDPCIVEESDLSLEDLEEDRIIKVPRVTEYLNYFRTKPRLAIQEVAGRRTVAENAFFNSVSPFELVFNKENHIFKQDDLRINVGTFTDVSDYLYNKEYFKNPDHPECYRYIHLDMAEKKDRFGMASVYCRMVKYTGEGGNTLRVRKYFIDFCLGVSSSRGEAVDLLKILEFIYGLKKQGYPVKKVTTDSHQGELARQLLRRHGVETEYQSVEKTKDAYFFLKNLILTQTLSGFKNKILTRELAGLRETNKRVEKAKGSTDDLCDALAGACFLASQDTHFMDNNEAITEMINTRANIAHVDIDWKLQNNDIDFSRFNDFDYLSSLNITQTEHFHR